MKPFRPGAAAALLLPVLLLSALAVAQAPGEKPSRGPTNAPAVRQETVARAAPDIEAEIAALPYRVGDRAGFRPVRVAGESATFTDESSGAGAQATITLSPQFRSLPQVPNVQRDQILRQLALNDPGLTDAVIETLGAVQTGEILRYEVVARGKAAGSGQETIRMVAVLFSGGTPLSVVATAPENRQDEIVPRLRSFVRSISGRP